MKSSPIGETDNCPNNWVKIVFVIKMFTARRKSWTFGAAAMHSVLVSNERRADAPYMKYIMPHTHTPYMQCIIHK